LDVSGATFLQLLDRDENARSFAIELHKTLLEIYDLSFECVVRCHAFSRRHILDRPQERKANPCARALQIQVQRIAGMLTLVRWRSKNFLYADEKCTHAIGPSSQTAKWRFFCLRKMTWLPLSTGLPA
jgi:hypothetical protein